VKTLVLFSQTLQILTTELGILEKKAFPKDFLKFFFVSSFIRKKKNHSNSFSYFEKKVTPAAFKIKATGTIKGRKILICFRLLERDY